MQTQCMVLLIGEWQQIYPQLEIVFRQKPHALKDKHGLYGDPNTCNLYDCCYNPEKYTSYYEKQACENCKV
jgi:hypothetical protein